MSFSLLRKGPDDGGSVLRLAADSTLDLLYPPRCVHCAADLPLRPGELLICRDCQRRLAPPRSPACRRCGTLVPPGFPSPGRCRRCKHRRLAFSAVVALGKYEEQLRRAVLAVKHASHDMLAAGLAELLWQRRQAELIALAADLVVPIPMFWLRRLYRGANSPETIAAVLARRLNIPWLPVLSRRRNTLPQGRLTPLARFDNVRGAFRLRNGYDCSGARVLLVDDILTTGATCNEAGKVLRRHGAARVAVAVLARAEGPD
jgi:competence protein ComFC